MLSLSCCAAGVPLRKFLPISINSRVFPTLSCCVSYFLDRVFLYAWAGLDCSYPICASTHSCNDKHEPLPAMGFDGVFRPSPPGWPGARILLITSRVTKITGLSHNTYYTLYILLFPPCRTRVWTQGFKIAKHALYSLSHTSSSFLFWLFCKWDLMNYLPGLQIASQVARIIGVSHQHWLTHVIFCWTPHLWLVWICSTWFNQTSIENARIFLVFHHFKWYKSKINFCVSSWWFLRTNFWK
jgi:hypothetical protein